MLPSEFKIPSYRLVIKFTASDMYSLMEQASNTTVFGYPQYWSVITVAVAIFCIGGKYLNIHKWNLR